MTSARAKPSEKITIVLHASEIAGLIGENRYNPVTNCLLKVFERCYPDKFTEISKESKFVKDDDLALQLLKEAGLGDQFADISKKEHEGRSEATQDFKDLNDKLKLSTLSDQDKKKVEEFASSKVNTKFGIKHEKAAFKLIPGAKEDTAVYCLECEAISGKSPNESLEASSDVKVPYKIVGKIDGRRSDTVIIEIKNRMYKFKIQPYDLVQVQVYLRLTGAKTCELHEALKDVRSAGSSEEEISMRCTNIAFDHEKWPELQDKISAFVVKLDKFSKDKNLQVKYLAMNYEQRKEVYEKL